MSYESYKCRVLTCFKSFISILIGVQNTELSELWFEIKITSKKVGKF